MHRQIISRLDPNVRAPVGRRWNEIQNLFSDHNSRTTREVEKVLTEMKRISSDIIENSKKGTIIIHARHWCMFFQLFSHSSEKGLQFPKMDPQSRAQITLVSPPRSTASGETRVSSSQPPEKTKVDPLILPNACGRRQKKFLVTGMS